MADRLDAADAALLRIEDAGAPQHTGTLATCHDPDGRLDYAELVARIRRHLATAPRYRQVVRRVPGRLADPVWVDDRAFDMRYHVRRSPPGWTARSRSGPVTSSSPTSPAPSRRCMSRVPGCCAPIPSRRRAVAPLQALSIGVTSYDGGVYYGLYADRAMITAIDVMAQCITDSLSELVEAAR